MLGAGVELFGAMGNLGAGVELFGAMGNFIPSTKGMCTWGISRHVVWQALTAFLILVALC